MGGVLAQTPPSPPPQEEELFLEVILNGEQTGLILRFTRGKTSGLRSSVQNLRDLELDPKLFGVEAQQEFELDQVKGLRYSYDQARQTIALRVDDALRAPVTVSGRTVRKPGVATVTPGAVLNYDAFSVLGQNRSTAISNELRYFNSNGVLTNTGIVNLSRQLRQYVRFDTAWVHSDPDTLETWTVGDYISSSLTWTRSLRMGGVQWKRSFDLRPDLPTFPAAALGGSAVVPSAVTLYINGVRQVETAVPSGSFIINQVAGINGAGQATLVTRDAAGRAVSTTLPLYVDTRMLAEGLTDYSVELGVLRRRYTTDSFGYARTPAASASLRRGLSDSLTLEAHAEGSSGVLNGGAGMLWRLGQGGVFFSISGTLGERISATVSRSRQNAARSTTTTLTRSADYGGGFGWGLQAVNGNGATQYQAQGLYLGNYGQVSAHVQENNGQRNSSVDVAGALVLMDGSVHAARQVGAGFALVSTDGVGGVPVLQENQVIGKTSGAGYMLVPNLNPYFVNQIGIDPSNLPLDARIASTGQGVVPARLAGVLVRFPVETYEAASVILHDADGKPLGAGIEVLHLESGSRSVVGYDGMAFIDHLAPLNHLRLTVDGKPCAIAFRYAAVKGNAMPTVGPYRCQGVQ